MSTEDELRRCREILAELHARHSELMVQLRLQTEAAQHSQRETLRLSRLLREAEHDVSRLRECRDTWKRQAEALQGKYERTKEDAVALAEQVRALRTVLHRRPRLR